ncbi:hypothetical protein MHBO_000209 [Bonamia ostreae]|uniref:Uncharacterized protein n=1 Tax=Bonamia ostreae TaxID=126728 RepID=A0ABV2AEU3_9EUKA
MKPSVGVSDALLSFGYESLKEMCPVVDSTLSETNGVCIKTVKAVRNKRKSKVILGSSLAAASLVIVGVCWALYHYC